MAVYTPPEAPLLSKAQSLNFAFFTSVRVTCQSLDKLESTLYQLPAQLPLLIFPLY